MSGHETVRDLRQDDPNHPAGLDRSLREGLPAQPSPDHRVRAVPDRRGWRIAATIVLALILIGVGVLVAGDDPEPADCARLHALAVDTQDITVVHEMTRIGCGDPPYDAVRWP